MLIRKVLFSSLCTAILGLAACGEAPKEPAKAEAPKPVEQELPHYDLTKDEITSHPEWDSRNVTVKGIKIGDKTVDVADKKLGPQLGETIKLENEYQTYYQRNGVAIYTFRLTGKVKRMEVLQGFADQVADAKLKKLLASGDLTQMRAIFGNEETTVKSPGGTGTEYVYDSRGIRFVKYKNGLNGLRFAELAK